MAEKILQTETPIILKEIGFLNPLRLPSEISNEDEEEDPTFIGRIDRVLVHPSNDPIDWCALEFQSVYFSGREMRKEFVQLSETRDAIPFPAVYRRPDWRSSGPKRLLPQLQTKVPEISNWGRKVAVVIDEAFFEFVAGLESEQVHPSNSQIAWFIVGYDKQSDRWKLVLRKVVFTKLEASVKALTAGKALSKEEFEKELLRKLRAKHPELQFPKK